MICILCNSSHSAPFRVDKKPEKSYFHCAHCDLIFMNPAERLGPEEEKARYDMHVGHGNAGHLAFLEPLVKDIDTYFKSASLGPTQLTTLDFGCGPAPFLSQLFQERGYKTFHYDLYYHPNQDELRRNYHLVTCTEVWEHFYNPRQEIEKQLRLIKAGGLLGVMTSAHRGEAVFHDWHYRRDPTHVTFFSEKTMDWLAENFKLRIIKGKSPYWIFQKLF